MSTPDAPTDYAAAIRLLKAPLPAYVSYTEHSSVGAGPFGRESSHTIVVRTRDGAVVNNSPDLIEIAAGHRLRANPVSQPAFDATCYSAAGASTATWSGRTVEAIELHDQCQANDDTETDFQTLYIDPVTHEPLAVEGENGDEHVTVTIEQRFAHFDGHLLPSRLTVHVAGQGIISFLNVNVVQEYTAYRFTDTLP